MTEQKRPRGRPTKLTPKVQQQVVRALSQGNYRVVAARSAGISYETFAGWMSKGAAASSGPLRDFYEAVIAAEVKAETKLLGFVMAQARVDPKHAKWILSHRWRDRWADNLAQGKLEVSGPKGAPLRIEDTRNRLLERLESLASKRAPPKGEQH